MDKQWRVYLAGCADGTLYVGISTDVPRRIREHNAGKGSKYIIKKRRPVVLLASVPASSRSVATSMERVLKTRLNRQQKLIFFGIPEWSPKEGEDVD